MIGVVIATHGDLARELAAAAEMILGSQEQVRTVSLRPGEDVDATRERLAAAIADCAIGGGVIVFTDMFGGTPSNLALTFQSDGKVEVVMGVNLPMLLKVLSLRGGGEEGSVPPLSELATAIAEHGRKNIQAASDILRKKSP